MALARVEPANVDVAIADAISGHTRPGPERAVKALKWGADEHILCAFGWLVALLPWQGCGLSSRQRSCSSDHALVSSALPHLLKVVFDQERPC
jgi:undecaprenyl-diphosphatase